MRIELARVAPRRQRLKSAPAQALVDEYLQRTRRYTPIELATYDNEPELLASLEKAAGRAPVAFVLLESRGQALTSEAFAGRLGQLRDNGTQLLVCAVGPADGWSAAASARAQVRLSFGAVTLPHELALVVAAEQLYRALTLLAGHPYHSGHS